MIERYFHNKMTWLDVLNPTTEEIHEIMEECEVPREYASDLMSITPKTEILYQKGAIKVKIDYPVVKRTDINRPHEIKFLVTKNHLVTIRFEEIEALHRFGKEYEVICMLKGKQKMSTELLFLTMLNYLYEALHEKLDYVESKLKDIEEEVFKGHEREMVFELSQISRRVIVFRQTISAHEDVLERLSEALRIAFGAPHAAACESLLNHFNAITRRVKALVSMQEYLHNTNNSLLSTKQNEIMKFLTVISFITFPSMLMSSIFGMNTQHTPLIGEQHDFLVITGSMLLLTIIILVYFKLKRWI